MVLVNPPQVGRITFQPNTGVTVSHLNAASVGASFSGWHTTTDAAVHVAADIRLDTPALVPKATITVCKGVAAITLSVDQARALLVELDERLRQVVALVPCYADQEAA